MLSEDSKKELDKYNQEKKTRHKPTHNRMAKVNEQDHEEADSPDNPGPALDNEFHVDSYHMQDMLEAFTTLLRMNQPICAKGLFSSCYLRKLCLAHFLNFSTMR